MKTILVSGSSGIVGYGILRSLRKSGKDLRLIGTTIYEDSAANGFCDIFEKAVATNHQDYIGWLLSITKKHKVDLIIPGIEADLYNWVEHISEIQQSGSLILLNNIELILLCKDKWSFYNHFKKYDFPNVIKSSISPNFNILKNEFGLPFLLKPRRGFGSKGIVIVDSLKTFLKYQHDMGIVLIAQELVGTEDEEFTTSAFCDGKGNYFATMTLKRKLSKDGFTEKAEVVFCNDIDNLVKQLCSIYKPIGPTNFQFRKHKGVYKLLEINPRISSSTSIRAAFGYNESLMAVQYYLENEIPQQPSIKKGRAIRFVEDMIFYL